MKNTAAIERFSILPEHVLKSNISPRAKELFAYIASLTGPKIKEFWAARSKFTREMDVSLSTLKRALNDLLNAGIIKKIPHKLKFGMHVCYQIFWSKDEFEANLHEADVQTESHCVAQEPVAVEPVVQVPAKVITENPLAHRLCSFGISRVVADKLFAQFGEERCVKQLEHLDSLLAKGSCIANKAAWLVTAIKQDYSFVPEVAVQEVVVEVAAISSEEQELLDQHTTQALELLKQAQIALNHHEYDSALSLAQQSLELQQTAEGRSLESRCREYIAAYQDFVAAPTVLSTEELAVSQEKAAYWAASTKDPEERRLVEQGIFIDLVARNVRLKRQQLEQQRQRPGFRRLFFGSAHA